MVSLMRFTRTEAGFGPSLPIVEIANKQADPLNLGRSDCSVVVVHLVVFQVWTQMLETGNGVRIRQVATGLLSSS